MKTLQISHCLENFGPENKPVDFLLSMQNGVFGNNHGELTNLFSSSPALGEGEHVKPKQVGMALITFVPGVFYAGILTE